MQKIELARRENAIYPPFCFKKWEGGGILEKKLSGDCGLILKV